MEKIHFKHGSISSLEAKKKELEKLLREAQNDEISSVIANLKNQIYWINCRIARKQKELADALISLRKEESGSYVMEPEAQIIRVEDLLNETEAELYDEFKKSESLKEENIRLKQKIESLKDELRRLKNLPAKPQLHPNNNPNQGKVQHGKPRPKGGKTGGSKKGEIRRSRKNLEIHRTEILPPPDNIPEGFKFKGYKDVIVQDLNFQALNTLFKIPRFYNPKTHQTMKISLPAGVKGHFGGHLRAFILYLNHQGRVPERLIGTLLSEAGIEISAGQIHNILTQDHALFHEEKKEILEAALQSSPVIQTDDTGARHSGHNGFCNIICNELFTVYNTTQSKSRLNFLIILAGNRDSYIFNEDAIIYLHRIGTPQKWIELFAKKNLSFIKKDLEKFLKSHKIQKKIYQNILESGLIGALFENDFNPDLIIHSDGAKQFALFVHCLCWIHAIRPINKIIPVNDHQALIIKLLLRKCWKFYKKLGKYKQNPSKALAKKLNKEFDKLFNQKTGFKALNEVLSSIMDNKSKLLLVLIRPEAPIHNNATETEAREVVIKNKISKTGSEAGKQSRDSFLSLMKTSRKLGISFWEYLNDRIFNLNQIPPLGDLIRQKAQCQPLSSAVA